MTLTRRGLMTAAAGSALAGCASRAAAPRASVRRVDYGADRSQFGELYLPGRVPRATIVVIHGGYWLDGFVAEAMHPMCRALQADGYAVWNLEYRRIGGGGGWPTTFTDVAAGIDHLADLDVGDTGDTVDTVDTGDVRLVGHSAGGQLAVWAASRRDTTPGGPSRVTVTRCVSLAGLLDLTAASRAGLGAGNVERLMGGTPAQVPERYAVGDPTRMVPAGCPVAVVHPSGDQVVPREQSTAYVEAARAAGASVSLTEVPGDHASVIDPTSEAWPTVTDVITG